MLKTKEILDEKDKRLRLVSDEVTFPITNKDKKAIHDMIEYLHDSQIEELSEKYNIRPGMGLAFPQLGINERIFVVVYEYEQGKFKNYVIVNPKIVSYSDEMIAAEAGEGCLSVNREVPGHVKRHARITVEGFDENGKPIRLRLREEVSIAFQHEYDHLDGILFYDRIDKKKPFFTEDEIRLI